MITISFPLGDNIVCRARGGCTTSQQRRRQITVQPQRQHEALPAAHAEQDTDAWKATCHARAGIEGTISQTVAITRIRDARYTGISAARPGWVEVTGGTL